MPTLDRAAPLLDELVASGGLVGWVAGVAGDGLTDIRQGGHQRIGGPAMRPDTLFAIASCTKPIGGALALALVERGDLGLDEPVARWLPELASPSVLIDPAGDLGDVVPAERPITLRHLLTMTAGFGWVVEGGPLAAAMGEQGIAPGPFPPAMPPDEYLRRLAALPLAHQPGETWMYHTGFDVLGVLLARVSGRSVADLLAEHVTGPLGLESTGFTAVDPQRLAAAYGPPVEGEPVEGEPAAYDVPPGIHTAPPRFESLSAGLVSSVPDHLTFLTALLDGGGAILSAGSVAEMTRDQLTTAQRPGTAGFLAEGAGWGLGVEVTATGRFGWAGGLGTIGYADPAAGWAGVLFTQHSVESPATMTAFDGFLAALGN